jgi:hypothetical protein
MPVAPDSWLIALDLEGIKDRQFNGVENPAAFWTAKGNSLLRIGQPAVGALNV